MSKENTWFIFDNSGELLFKTNDESKTILTKLPHNFNATYIVKNPKDYNPDIAQSIKFDIDTKTITIKNNNELENIYSSNIISGPIIDKDVFIELVNKIKLLEAKIENINSTVNQNTQKLENFYDLIDTTLTSD